MHAILLLAIGYCEVSEEGSGSYQEWVTSSVSGADKYYMAVAKAGDERCTTVCAAACETARPVCIMNGAENEFVTNTFQHARGHCHHEAFGGITMKGCILIGYYQGGGAVKSEPSGGWTWGTCDSSYVNWGHNEPNEEPHEDGHREDCTTYNVHDGRDDKWADFSCTEEGGCLCESSEPGCPATAVYCPGREKDYDEKPKWDDDEEEDEGRGRAVGFLVFLAIVFVLGVGGTLGGVFACYKLKCCCWSRPHPVHHPPGIEVSASNTAVATAVAMPVATAVAVAAQPVVATATAVPMLATSTTSTATAVAQPVVATATAQPSA